MARGRRIPASTREGRSTQLIGGSTWSTAASRELGRTEGIGVIPLKNTKTRIFRNLAGTLAVLGIAMFGFAQAPAAASVTGINLAESSDMGQYLVDATGMALYLFVPDAQGASTGYDACATSGPPVTGESADALPTSGEGLDQALLGTVERDDGTLQVTYNGWPLYYYLGDMEAGVATGQGLGDNWYVLDATGTAIGQAAAAPDRKSTRLNSSHVKISYA